VIYISAKRLGLNPRLAATLGTGGAVCGVSGAIAIGGAVGAKKEDVSVAISLVVVWAVVMIFALPLAAKSLHLATGVAPIGLIPALRAESGRLRLIRTNGGDQGPQVRVDLIAHEDPKSKIAEAFREVRTALLVSQAGAQLSLGHRRLVSS